MTCSNKMGVDGDRASLISCGYPVDNYLGCGERESYPQVVLMLSTP